MRTLPIIVLFAIFTTQANGQHLRIYACAIANDSAGASLGASSNGSGLYQSDDTGKTWMHLGWDNIKCYSMDMVQSSNGCILYEATGLGILRSVDGGQHWNQITDWRISEAMDVAVNQKNPNEIYIATAHGPWRTRDGGKNWIALTVPDNVPYVSRVKFDTSNYSYALFGGEDGLFRYKLPNSLNPNGLWYSFTLLRRIRDIQESYPGYWVAASESVGLFRYTVNDHWPAPLAAHEEDLWCVADIESHRKQIFDGSTLIAAGGQRGFYFAEESDVGRPPWDIDSSSKNVASCIVIRETGWPPFHIAGTLGDGIFAGGTHELQGRQIWTLKSFLVTP
jgi:hypothetical protein